MLNDSSSFAHFWHTGALAGRGEALEGRALQLQLRAERPQVEQADFWQWHKDIGTWQFWQAERLVASREARRTRGRGADAVRGDAVAEGAFAAIAVTAVTAVIAAFAVTAAFSVTPAGAALAPMLLHKVHVHALNVQNGEADLHGLVSGLSPL